MKNVGRKPNENMPAPLNYYSKDLSELLSSKLSDYYDNKVAKSDSSCGSVYQDLPGTAQGVWMLKGSAEDGQLEVSKSAALVHSNFDMTVGVFSLGSKVNSTGLDASKIMPFKPAKSGIHNLDFGLLKPSNDVYCYDTYDQQGTPDNNKSILVQLADANLLKIGKNNGECGTGPWQMSKVAEYTR